MSELATYILCGAECRDVCISTHIGGVRGSRDVWTSDAYYIIVYPYEENAGCVDWLCTISALFVLCDALGILFVHAKATPT